MELRCLASLEQLDYGKIKYSELGMPLIEKLENHFLDLAQIDLDSATVLFDDKPVLEHIYTEAALEWKRLSNEFYTKGFINSNLIVVK